MMPNDQKIFMMLFTTNITRNWYSMVIDLFTPPTAR